MILVCPSCDTRYFAADAAIGKDGRRVRCASCGHSWFTKSPDEGAPAPVPDEETGLTREQVERLRQTAAANSAARTGPHAEFRAREHSRRQRQRSMATILAWVFGFGVFAASAAALVIFRNDVVEVWPRTASFYKLAGLEVNRFGLVLRDEDARRSFDGTTPVLTVTGTVVNESEAARAAPLIRISLRDEAGVEVHTWTDEIGVDEIGPGESASFTSRIVAPPVETFRLKVTFADRDAPQPAHSGAPAEDGAHLKPSAATGGDPKDHAGAEGADDYEEPPWNGGDGDGEEDVELSVEAPESGAGDGHH